MTYLGHVLLLPAVLAAVLVACGGDGAKVSQGADQINVVAGLNDPNDVSVAVLEFLPESVTIAVGKSVEWRIAGPEPHSVTFFPPGQQAPTPGSDPSLFMPTPLTGPFDGKKLVNSGLLPQGPTAASPFKVTFPTAGSFTYYCVIHPKMTGTVTVVDAKGKAETQAAVTSRGEREKAKWLEEGRAAKKKLIETPPVVERAADGTSTYKVLMGASTPHTDILAFNPLSLTLKAGDNVTFVNTSEAPHTASFAGTTVLPTDPTSPQAEKAVPGPSPQTLNTTDYFNSGFLPPNAGPPGSVPPEAARSFTFAVRTVGSYTVICIVHAASGMAGNLKVA